MEREEAIDVIRNIYQTDKEKEALETLIPELKESEDERVRKEIYNFLIDMECKKEWIAYLEKQKEQQPAEWKPLPESMEALLLAIEGKWDAIKPTGYMSRRLEDLYDGLVNTFDVDEKYLSNLPKTEYTEKDIEEIKALKEKIDSSMETKPAEWSEEDEAKITFLERLIRYNVPDGQYGWVDGHKGGFVTKLEAISMLKSLRPSWKPSEEQVDALRIYLYHPQYIDNSEDIKIKLVESLYNDLKKLM